MARAAADPVNPVVLLSLVKHRFARLGLNELALGGRARDLEKEALRGPRPRDVDQLLERLNAHPDALEAARRLTDAVALARAPFDKGKARAPEAMRALAEAMEKLASDEKGSTGDLWAGAGGESAAGFIAEMLRESEALPPVEADVFCGLVEKMLRQETVRSGGASHPRLRILGAMEARLVQADTLILAGLEEGVWPGMPAVDPFLSRGMRASLGLPPPERKIGLAAHDFAQGASSREVLLVVRQKRGGQPAVKSRWIWRLETLAKGAGLALPRDEALEAARRALDARIEPAPKDLAPAERPDPRPPVSARPRELPVTAIETWVRDPYGVYARYVLKLRSLDRPDQPFDNRVRGSAVHKAAERYALAWPPQEIPLWRPFARYYVEELTRAGAPDVELVREQALGERAGRWMADFEKGRRKPGMTVRVEAKGTLPIETALGQFTLTARADRLEIFEGRGFAPQLTLTAAIARHGGFSPGEDLPPSPLVPEALLYVRLTGRDPEGEVSDAFKGDVEGQADAALAGLVGLVNRFADPDMPYRARTAVQFLNSPSDYDHLSRFREWASAEADG
jgi:ATP-dependent helicase/nuclease subunit B